MTGIDYTDCVARAGELLARAETPGAGDAAVRDRWTASAGAYSVLAQAEALGRIADAVESLLARGDELADGLQAIADRVEDLAGEVAETHKPADRPSLPVRCWHWLVGRRRRPPTPPSPEEITAMAHAVIEEETWGRWDRAMTALERRAGSEVVPR